jgi:16S rRNA (guanine527-N7)-methyltransferase
MNLGIELINRYFPGLSNSQKLQFYSLLQVYTEWNEKINVISRKDMDNFYERHVLHSLAIARFISFKPGTRVLDFGTGGGFPGIPLAILFPEVSFHLVDSIGKKITVVNEVVKALGLQNVVAEKQRVEELKSTYDFITCRGVTELSTIIKWTSPLFTAKWKNDKPNGWLLLKGGDIKSELKDAQVETEKILLSDYFKEEFFKEKYLLYIRR